MVLGYDVNNLEPRYSLHEKLHIVPREQIGEESLLVDYLDQGAHHVVFVVKIGLFADYPEMPFCQTCYKKIIRKLV